MPLYLCALRKIEPITDYELHKGFIKAKSDIGEKYTFAKKEECKKYIEIPVLDTPYTFLERKIFRLSASWAEFDNWESAMQYTLSYKDIFINRYRLFENISLLGYNGTIFQNDCAKLDFEFKDWNAFIEAKTKSNIRHYEIFLTLKKALEFAKEGGALWHFNCEENEIDDYLEAKKSIQFHGR